MTIRHTFFERFIIFLIICSSVKLAVDTYYTNDKEASLILTRIDGGFTCIFGFEALLKIVAFGFIIDKGSYLRENWNILDFFIVIS